MARHAIAIDPAMAAIEGHSWEKMARAPRPAEVHSGGSQLQQRPAAPMVKVMMIAAPTTAHRTPMPWPGNDMKPAAMPATATAAINLQCSRTSAGISAASVARASTQGNTCHLASGGISHPDSARNDVVAAAPNAREGPKRPSHPSRTPRGNQATAAMIVAISVGSPTESSACCSTGQPGPASPSRAMTRRTSSPNAALSTPHVIPKSLR